MRRAAVVALFTVSLVVVGCDWPQAGFDAANSGTNNANPSLDLASVSRLAPRWSQDSGVGEDQSVVVVHGHALVLSSSGLVAIDPSSGATQWSAENSGDFNPALEICNGGPDTFLTSVVPSVAVLGGQVLFHNLVVSCPPDTAPVFSFSDTLDVATGVTSPTVVAERSDAVVASDGSEYDIETQLPGLTSPATPVLRGPNVFYGPGPSLGPPTLGATRVFLTAGNSLVSVSTADGTQLWQTPLPAAGPLGRPSTDGARTYITDGAQVLAFDAATGRAAWTATLDGTLDTGGPTVSGDTVFVQEPDKLVALDATSGTTAWTAPLSLTAEPEPSRPTVANGVVYTGSGDQLSMFDASGATGCTPAQCAPVKTITLAGPIDAQPVVVNGSVFVNAGTKLYKLALP